MKKKLTIALIAALLLAGCASDTGLKKSPCACGGLYHSKVYWNEV